MTFGERLTQLRKENGYTVRNDFAEKLGIPGTTLRNYEIGAREPGHSFLIQISEFFNVSVDYLLCLTDEKDRVFPFNLKSAELEHIKKYRTLDEHGKKMVDIVLEEEYSRCKVVQKSEKVSALHQEEPDHLRVRAAHERTDIEVTDKMRKHDDDIMNDPDF